MNWLYNNWNSKIESNKICIYVDSVHIKLPFVLFLLCIHCAWVLLTLHSISAAHRYFFIYLFYTFFFSYSLTFFFTSILALVWLLLLFASSSKLLAALTDSVVTVLLALFFLFSYSLMSRAYELCGWWQKKNYGKII